MFQSDNNKMLHIFGLTENKKCATYAIIYIEKA